MTHPAISAVLEGRSQWAVVTGDCLAVLPTLPPGSVNAVVTDPPYGLDDLLHSPGHTQGNRWAKLFGDGAPAWDKETAGGVVQLASMPCPVIVWGGNYYPLPPSRGWLVWDKVARNWTSGHVELAWTNLDQPTRAFNYARCELANEGKEHPTQKPLPLMAWCLSFVPPGALILDPFCGSGTTGVAAIQTGRRFIGIEIDEKYAAIARRRIADAAPLFVPPPAAPDPALFTERA